MSDEASEQDEQNCDKKKKTKIHLPNLTATINGPNMNLIPKISRKRSFRGTRKYLITTWAEFAPSNFALLIAVHVIYTVLTRAKCC